MTFFPVCNSIRSFVSRAEIESMDNQDIRGELFRSFAKADIPLITLSMEKTTLEEIFLELTQGKNPVELVEITEEKTGESEAETDESDI